MAITVTTILGTDSLTASRPILNDNFNILKDEINAIESYIDPDAGTISGLVSLQSGELRVGPTNSYFLELSASAFTISTPVEFSATTGVNEFAGRIAHNSFASFTSTGLTYSITPTTGFRNYMIRHLIGGTLTISVGIGYPGQEVTICCEQLGGASPDIEIVEAGNGAPFVFAATGNNTATLDEVGANITLKCVTDYQNNQYWILVSSHNATLS
jgi:hypothetical protein